MNFVEIQTQNIVHLIRRQELLICKATPSHMDDNSSMSIATAAQQAKQNPDDAADAIQTLFEYVDAGDPEASDAAKSLSSIAKRVPAAFDGQTANFEQALGTADGVHTRRNLAEAVNNLIDQHAIPLEDAGRALTEATRIRDDEYWEDRPKSELLIIRKGLDGYGGYGRNGPGNRGETSA